MGGNPTESVKRVTRLEWLVLVLLVASVAINYIDRGTLSIAGVALSSELHLKPHELGFLLSAFFWTYAGFQVVAGWLIDRFNVITVLGVGFLIWSLATALTGLVSGFVALFILRLLLGISESVSYPSYSKIIVATFPEEQRGFANGLIDVGGKLGPAVGLVAGGLILDGFGWRAVFLSLGFASLIWLVPWLLVAPRIGTVRYATVPASGPSLVDILKKREAWGTLLGLFCSNYAWYFMLTWLPQYLLTERHYSTRMMALVGWLPFCATAAGAVLGGWLSDAWIRRGASATTVRKSFCVTGLTGAAVLLLPSALAVDPVRAMSLLILASFVFGLYTANLFAVTQTLAGVVAAGKWTGLQNGVGNLAGIVAPIVTGFIVERTGEFYFAFVWVSVLLLVGALSYLLIIRKVAPVPWGNSVLDKNAFRAISSGTF
jgi:ACS family D-galactonate transporter-like MFS transporter